MIDTVIFDVGNVLTRFGWQEFIRSFGYAEDICVRVGNATIESPYWKEYDRGVMSNDEIVNSFISLDKGVEKEIRETMENFEGILTPADYAIPWIESLKSMGLRVLFLSNFSERACNECRDALGFLDHVDGGIFSYRVKLIKPDPAIYKCIVDTYGLVPDRCVFIDDLEENIKAAGDYGMHTILFRDYETAKEKLRSLLNITK